MKKLLPSAAMFLIMVDCFTKSLGMEQQNLFADDFVWLWAFVGIGWFLEIILFTKSNEEIL